MKLSNFKYTKRTGINSLSWKFYGTVDVTTTAGFMFWKEQDTVEKEICREFANNWFFVETGEYTPGVSVETMERAWNAQNDSSLEDYIFPHE